MKVFISYAREDIEIAKKLRDDLEKAGIRTWLDWEDLLVGQDWQDEIIKQIHESEYFIALISSTSVAKRGVVQTELNRALEILDKSPPNQIFILPIRIDECLPQHEKLKRLHWADLFPSYQEGLKKILRVLIPEIKQPSNETKPIPKVESVSSKVSEVRKEIKIEPAPQPTLRKPKYQLRKEPITTDNSRDLVINRDVENEFEDNKDGTITDHATGLMWQKSGSPNYMSYKDAMAYIEKLKREKFAKFDDWRLPTVDELKSLLTPKKMNGNLYIDPIFDKTQIWCWTSDKRAAGGAWAVNFYNGLVYWNDDLSYVRAVRLRQ